MTTSCGNVVGRISLVGQTILTVSWTSPFYNDQTHLCCSKWDFLSFSNFVLSSLFQVFPMSVLSTLQTSHSAKVFVCKQNNQKRLQNVWEIGQDPAKVLDMLAHRPAVYPHRPPSTLPFAILSHFRQSPAYPVPCDCGIRVFCKVYSSGWSRLFTICQ